ncbi:MAG TPA: four helix bundle protein [Thermoflexales bacterium]|nr:four helix bundle protein [Thermoflexales bacterium]HQW34776.1 four helix bundle protein [Thermoflexales bacterium]HRA00961.1 four helix bundle protein [Thermoflexales bacterium]
MDILLMTEPQILGHEKLDVYQASITFLALVDEILGNLPSGSGAISNQLDRAALSIPLNIAEGAGKSGINDKRRFYSIARGSAMECGAIFDALKIRGKISQETYAQGKHLLVRIVSMLTKM